MAEVPGSIVKILQESVDGNSPVTAALFTNQVAANINGLIDRKWRVDEFTSSGSWQVPSDVDFVMLIGCGGGGGGQGGGASTAGSSFKGSNGGTTSFGSLADFKGGAGGTGNDLGYEYSNTGSILTPMTPGGRGFFGNDNQPGNSGLNSVNHSGGAGGSVSITNDSGGGGGGAGPFGNGARGGDHQGANSPEKGDNAAANTGAGGGGGSSEQSNHAGAGGAGSIATSRIISVTPNDVISVTIGNGGAGGVTSQTLTSANGGNGGSGRLFVIYYSVNQAPVT